MLTATVNLMVPAIEPCLEFWEERLGFERLAEVPHDDALGFVMLKHGDVQVMLQTHDSTEADMKEVAELSRRSVAFLFITVEDVDDIIRRLDGWDFVVKRRETFYGATETTVREPGGNVVTFAQFGA